MALSPQDKAELISYIEGRTCEEFRQGEPCLDRTGPVVVELAEPHPGCARAGRMIGLVRDA